MYKKVDVTKSRFRDANWFNKLTDLSTPIIIGGAGGIGSWLLLLLSRVINSNLPVVVYDFDRVEEVNLAGQLYKTTQVGKLKVDAVAEIAREFSGYKETVAQNIKFDTNSLSGPIMFSAFDNMQARKDMFQNWKREVAKVGDGPAIFIDGRLLAEQLQVFFVTPERSELYEKYLFNDTEVADTSCSYKQTSHFAAIIAARMVQGFTNWIADDGSEVPFYYEEIGNLFLNEIKNE